jgi:hypothetical protein
MLYAALRLKAHQCKMKILHENRYTYMEVNKVIGIFYLYMSVRLPPNLETI